ncbi:hypothetical protein VKT23_015415 [Stygiomarasmius scandens]|uniref:Glucose-methanol-choline oxidoreductase N-terminal domain-containing protein n=1 Tax=Marasmiellus scandens TaxID=2682957 RepID=A0ABR1IXL8_9AGAR
MVYNRGSKGDWDRYAEVTGDSGWSWDNIQRYIVKNERFTPPADRHNTSGQFDPSIHSFNGTNAVSLSGFNGYVLESAVLSASQQLGGPFSFVLDYNSGSALGFGWYQSTINGANRSSAAVSYLHPALTRPNLHVLLNARVSRVLPTGSGENSRDLNIKTVEFAQDIEDGPFIQLTATKEVILSSGSVGTPHILLNSGIGNSTTLSSLGKSVVFDLPSVGQNVSVHPLTHPVFVVNSSITTEDPIFQNSSFRAELLQQWSETGTGPLVKTRGTFNAQMRLDDDFIQKLGIDPSSSPTSPHFTLVTQNSFYPLSPPNGSYLSFLILVDSPTSRGSITLSSSNPFSPPVIDVACLETLFDLLAMRAAVKAVLEYTSTPAWEGYILGPFTDLANATSSDDPEELDKRLDDYIRATTEPTGHIVGTASMSRKGAPFGVVDPDLAVKGIKGLRVVDASVLPYVPSGHTQVPVYIVAERAADLIKAQWA